MDVRTWLNEALEQLNRATTPPWRWWTSCSFRRLSSDLTGKDGDVAYGTVHPHDKHPDIAISQENMNLIVDAVNDRASVLRLVEALMDLHNAEDAFYAPSLCGTIEVAVLQRNKSRVRAALDALVNRKGLG